MSKACVLFLAVPCLAVADYQPTSCVFPNWTVTTSENLYEGRTHRGYRLANLFDGSPDTAWVFSGVAGPDERKERQAMWSGQVAIGFEPHRPIVVDGIDLMNGYMKSTRTFGDNRRAVEVAIYDVSQPYDEVRPLKVVLLSDRPGWHHISLPRKAYRHGLSIVFRRFAGKPDSDVALSELRFTVRGRPVPVQTGKAYAFTTGSDCGCETTWTVFGASGKVLAQGNDEGATLESDPSARYWSGLEYKSASDLRRQVWVADLIAGKVISRRTLPRSKRGYYLTTDRKTKRVIVTDGILRQPVSFRSK